MVQHIKANEPASLLLTLTPYKTAIHARITSDPEKDFPAFINSDIQHIGDDPRTVPGYWFLHVDYKHKKDIPELSSTDLILSIDRGGDGAGRLTLLDAVHQPVPDGGLVVHYHNMKHGAPPFSIGCGAGGR